MYENVLGHDAEAMADPQVPGVDAPGRDLGGHRQGGLSRREIAMSLPPGQRDYSTVRLSRHALERFVERFAAEPALAADEFRGALARTRRLGRNPENGAIAVLGDLPRPGAGGDRPAGDLPDRPDLEPVPAAARRVRPRQAAPQVGTGAAAGLRRVGRSVKIVRNRPGLVRIHAPALPSG